MSQETPLKVGLFGAVHPHAELHAKTLAASSLVGEVVLFDPDAAAARALVESMGDSFSAETDLERLLSQGGLDAGLAAYPNHENAELCGRLLERGIPVLSEKPAGLNAVELEGLVEQARKADCPFGVMYQSRYHPMVREVRDLIRRGYLGTLTGCEGRLITSQPRFRNPEHWLFDSASAGGGILSWLGCHFLDLFIYLTERKVEAISGMVDTLNGDAIDVEDVAAVLLKFEGGAIGSLTTGYQLPLSSEGFVYPNYESYLSFRGTLGRVWWNPFDPPLQLHVESRHPDWKAAPSRTITYELEPLDAYGGTFGLEFFDDFFRGIRSKSTPPAPLDAALTVARLVEAAYASSRTGRHQEV